MERFAFFCFRLLNHKQNGPEEDSGISVGSLIEKEHGLNQSEVCVFCDNGLYCGLILFG